MALNIATVIEKPHEVLQILPKTRLLRKTDVFEHIKDLSHAFEELDMMQDKEYDSKHKEQRA